MCGEVPGGGLTPCPVSAGSPPAPAKPSHPQAARRVHCTGPRGWLTTPCRTAAPAAGAGGAVPQVPRGLGQAACGPGGVKPSGVKPGKACSHFPPAAHPQHPRTATTSRSPRRSPTATSGTNRRAREATRRSRPRRASPGWWGPGRAGGGGPRGARGPVWLPPPPLPWRACRQARLGSGGR